MDTHKLLQDKVIVVTGGTKGVGRSLVIEAARQGAKVVIGGRSKNDGDEIVNIISTESPGSAIFVAGDITQVSACENLIAAAVDEYGRLDGLVNYAGILPSCTLPDMEEDMFNQVFDLNVKAAFFCCKYAIPAMQKSGGGSVINIGSVHAYGGEIDRPAYACSKGALLTLTKHIAKNYAKDRIRGNWITMGWVATPGEMALRTSQGRDIEWLKNIAAESIPLGRLLTEEDHLLGILYLLSDYSSMVTGTELQNAGGFMP